jgi:nucleoid-associated protein YgaU
VPSLSRIKPSILGLALLASLAFLPGCGGASRVNPGSQDETGSVTDQAREKPSVYQVKPGDTLAKISARPEIYGDKDLWPLLVASNQDLLSPGKALAPGSKLLIRRDLTEEDKAVAREQARAQAARAPKAKAASAKQPVPAPPAAASAPAPAPAKPAPAAPAAPAKPAPSAPASSAAPSPAPAPQKKGHFLPIILIFLFMLLVALVVLLYVMRRENKG